MPDDLGIKIKKLRLEKGMTLEDVAKIVGVGKSTVRKWEVGMIENMRRDKISLLAKALGTTPEYLFGWNKNAEPPLNSEDKSLLKKIQSLTNEERKIIIDLVNTMYRKNEDEK